MSWPFGKACKAFLSPVRAGTSLGFDRQCDSHAHLHHTGLSSFSLRVRNSTLVTPVWKTELAGEEKVELELWDVLWELGTALLCQDRVSDLGAQNPWSRQMP